MWVQNRALHPPGECCLSVFPHFPSPAISLDTVNLHLCPEVTAFAALSPGAPPACLSTREPSSLCTALVFLLHTLQEVEKPSACRSTLPGVC